MAEKHRKRSKKNPEISYSTNYNAIEGTLVVTKVFTLMAIKIQSNVALYSHPSIEIGQKLIDQSSIMTGKSLCLIRYKC